MAPLSAAAFGSLVGGLDRAEFERFVAAVWRARGYTVDREAGLLVATPAGADGAAAERSVWVHQPGRWPLSGGESPPAAADVVVTSAPDSPDAGDRRVIGVEDLHGMVFYGIDRDTCRELFVEFFGARPAALAGGTTFGRASTVAVAVVLAAAAVLVGVQAAVPGGVAAATDLLGPAAAGTHLDGLLGPTTPEPRFDRTTATAAPATTAAAAERFGTSTTTDPPDEPPRDAADFVPDGGIAAAILNATPGVGVGGIEDARTLTDTHARVVVNRSYRLEITYRKFENGSLVGVARERARVRPDGAETAVVYDGYLDNHPDIIAELQAGRADIEEPPETETGRESGAASETGFIAKEVSPIGYAERMRQYLFLYLTAEESWIARAHQVNSTYRYIVELRGAESESVTDVTGRAVVDENGVVHELRHAYRVPGTEVRVVTTIEYTDLEYAGGNGTTTAGSRSAFIPTGAHREYVSRGRPDAPDRG